MKIDGRCHCGEISFEADVDPSMVFICHCPDCQTISGAPYRVNVLAPKRGFRVNGSPKEYVKIGGSGEEVSTMFCGTCGTALYSHKHDRQPFVFLRIGAVRQKAELVPTKQGFYHSALPWAMDIGDVPVVG